MDWLRRMVIANMMNEGKVFRYLPTRQVAGYNFCGACEIITYNEDHSAVTEVWSPENSYSSEQLMDEMKRIAPFSEWIDIPRLPAFEECAD